MPAAPPIAPAPWAASARLRLREFSAHDVDDLVRMHRDPRVRAQLVDDLPLDDAATASRFVAGLQQFYRRHEGQGIWCAERAVPPDADSLAEARAAHAAGEIGDQLLALVAAPEWRFAGWFSLVHVKDDPAEIEIGARLQPDAWGGALALDGGEWLLARAFAEPRRARVFGYCDPANRSAAHCLRVLGFSGLGLAPYNGQQAARFMLARAHWRHWHALPRRERLRRLRTD
ncbi:GNAT family N-acetyltransferase [Ottowia testudinis]|uniref:GNAT family N-acetyltransferase n=1 Tax=Ottowia testudinis TaxID=2816950 RepID=A0A975CIE3_9BURK|nr:GNAT family N-acetyltransferase [Ottowia testudinis]QTD45517.1 GNAT family N-acetyltransferase [Ottowia testudinis]